MQGFNSPPISSHQEIIFDTLPPQLASLAGKLFHDSRPTVVILPLTDLEKDIPSCTQWLHEKELEQLAGYRYPKRRQEWLAGRICAKQALRVFFRQGGTAPFIPAHNQYRVASEESGRPFFDKLPGVTFPFPKLSITHSKSFAAALVSTQHCGIDIQYPADSLQRVKERFCTEKEEQHIQETFPQSSRLSSLTLLWTGKEAIKKMLSPQGIPGFHEIQLDSITDVTKNSAIFHFSTPSAQQAITPVTAGLLSNGYGLTLCCQQSNP